MVGLRRGNSIQFWVPHFSKIMFEDSEMFSNKSSSESLFLREDSRKVSYKVDDRERVENVTIKVAGPVEQHALRAFGFFDLRGITVIVSVCGSKSVK
jgi:hypothetical protein